MVKNKLVLVVGLVILIVAVFFGYKYFTSGGMSPATSSPSNAVVPANTVVIQGNAFTPETLTVKVGTKVTWTNNDSYAHTVTANNKTFDSGNMSGGQSFSYTFTKVGTYDYYCAIHTFMTAKVVVTN